MKSFHIFCSGLVLGSMLAGRVAAAEAAVTNEEIQTLVKQLGSDEFDKRQKAETDLLNVGTVALEALKDAAQNATDPQIKATASRLVASVEKSASNLNQLGKACFMFADVPTNKDMFPADAAELYPYYITDWRVFSNPRYPDQVDAYMYVAGSNSNDATHVIAFENVPDNLAHNGRNVLLGAGSVEFMSAEKFAKRLKETEADLKAHGIKMKLVPTVVEKR